MVFPRTALEVHHGDDLELFTLAPMTDIFARPLPAFVEKITEVFDILHRILTAAIGQGLRPMAVRHDLTQISLVDTNEIGSLCRCELANILLRCGRECALLVRLQLARQFFGIRGDQRAQALTIFIACDVQHIGPDSIRAYYLISA